MTNKLSTEAQCIKIRVLRAMQHAEELGGVSSTKDYIQLMTELKKEIEDRIECAKSILEDEDAE